MQKTKVKKYCEYFIFTLLLSDFLRTYLVTSYMFRHILISVPLLLGAWIFSHLNKEKYNLYWSRAIISVALSTATVVTAYLQLCLVWNKVSLDYSISAEIVVWMTSIFLYVFLVLLVTVLFYIVLVFAGKTRFVKLKLSWQFVIAMLVIIILAAAIAFAKEACTPRVLASQIVGDFGRTVGHRYIKILEFAQEAIYVSVVWAIAMWADFCDIFAAKE